MANRARPTHQKRDRERSRIEWRKEKEARKAAAKARKAAEPRQVGGEDPDIAGIVPGPQPPRDDY